VPPQLAVLVRRIAGVRAAPLLAMALALALLAGIWTQRALTSGTPAPAGNSLTQQLPMVIGTLNEARFRERAALEQARTASAQERAAQSLAQAHRVAVAALRPMAGAAGAVLVERLTATARAYSDLAQAAGDGSALAVAAARRDVVRAEARTQTALGSVRLPASQPAAYAGSSGSTVLLVIVTFALLGIALAVLRIPDRVVAVVRAAWSAEASRHSTRRTPIVAGTATPPQPNPPLPTPPPRSRPTRPSAPPSPQPGATWPAAPIAAPVRRARRAPAPTAAERRPAPLRPAPFPPETGWSCEISWNANFRRASFLATAAAPGQSPRVIAESPKVSYPPLLPPAPHEDVLAAARALVGVLRAAGWKPIARGDSWYAQRFVWDRERDPQPLAR
jgi:hypothetical protein